MFQTHFLILISYQNLIFPSISFFLSIFSLGAAESFLGLGDTYNGTLAPKHPFCSSEISNMRVWYRGKRSRSFVCFQAGSKTHFQFKGFCLGRVMTKSKSKKQAEVTGQELPSDLEVGFWVLFGFWVFNGWRWRWQLPWVVGSNQFW